MKTLSLVLFFFAAFSSSLTHAEAPAGIRLHAVLYVAGKFHRYSNALHRYPSDHGFLPAILPPTIKDPANEDELMIRALAVPKIERMANGEYRFFYFTVDQMIAGVREATRLTRRPVARLQISGHGLPGGIFSAATWKQLASPECDDQRGSFLAPDRAIYDQYYGVTTDPFETVFKEMLEYDADNARYAETGQPASFGACSTGIEYWNARAKTANLPALFASGAQVNFFTCHQALGKLGRNFLVRLAGLLFPTSARKTGEVRAVDTYLGNDGSVSRGAVGEWEENTPESFQRTKNWFESRADIRAAAPFNLFSARQTGRGIRLEKSRLRFWRID